MVCHNTHDPFYRTPSGAVPAGTRLTVRLRCDDAADVILHTWLGEDRDYPMTADKNGVWTVTFHVPDATGTLWYDFIIYHTDGITQRYTAPQDDLGGEGFLSARDWHSFRVTVYDPAYRTPDFMHGAVIYQIFPDRFFKAPTAAVDTRTDRRMHEKWEEDFFPNRLRENGSMDFWGGTLNGIREKLPYLEQMGVTVLYLNPIFQAHSNHRYDTGDYTKIDPLLGTEEEFRLLCAEARKKGIHVMLDGVFSHTGDDSIYFNKYHRYDSVGAADGEESPYYRWYTFEHFPDKYRCWWGFVGMPECRKDEPSYREFMFTPETGIVNRWIRAGASGWRLDVADELTTGFLRELRASVKATDPEAVVLGEVWEDASNKEAYGEVRNYTVGDTLDSVMNYPLRTAILDFMTHRATAYDLARLVAHQADVYPPQFRYSLMNLLGSHDRARALNVLAGREGQDLPRRSQRGVRLTRAEYAAAVKRFKVCIDLICALPGCPTVYYGDEAGLTGCPDPFCRRPFPWGREDRDLQAYVTARMRHHRESPVLRTGLCEVEVIDDDALRIRRFMQGGRDGLGHPTKCADEEIFTIRRPD